MRERRLLRGAEAVRLSPKAYDVLVALVQQSGRLVTKDELLSACLARVVCRRRHSQRSRVSAAQGAWRRQRPPAYIETVARSGYRFIAAVTCDPANEKPFAPSAVSARPVELGLEVVRAHSPAARSTDGHAARVRDGRPLRSEAIPGGSDHEPAIWTSQSALLKMAFFRADLYAGPQAGSMKRSTASIRPSRSATQHLFTWRRTAEWDSLAR